MSPSTPPLRERCGLLKNAWYAAALSTELGSKHPLGRVVLGEMLVLFRDRSGAPVALLDRCPHRNALLSEGRVVAGCVQCPYHGWTFDHAGECVSIPSESAGGKTAFKRRTERFETRERDGLVWVWMGGNDVPPDREPFPMPYRNTPGWRSYYMNTEFNNDVTNLVENFMDVPHTVFVHRGWFRTRSALAVDVTVERSEEEVLVTYHQDKDAIGVSEWVLNPKRLPMAHTDHFFMPNTTRVDYMYGDEERGFVITSTCTPISDTRTQVYTLISYKLGWFGAMAKWFLPAYTRRVIGQDVDIMAVQRRALDHYGEARFNHTPADTTHLYIESLREWAQAGGEGPRPSPATKKLRLWI